MDKQTTANEFDRAEVFRKLTSKSEPQTTLQSMQAYFDEIERKRNFICELGQLCLKYGVGGISELEYNQNELLSSVKINGTYGKYGIGVNRGDDIVAIVRRIFTVHEQRGENK